MVGYKGKDRNWKQGNHCHLDNIIQKHSDHHQPELWRPQPGNEVWKRLQGFIQSARQP